MPIDLRRYSLGRGGTAGILVGMHPTSIQEEILRDALAALGMSVNISSQRMMGGYNISLKGHQFAHICGDGTGLRLSPEDQAALLSMPGAKPLVFPNDPARSAKFALVPGPMLDRLPEFASWVRKAVQFSSSTTGKSGPSATAGKKAHQKTRQGRK